MNVGGLRLPGEPAPAVPDGEVQELSVRSARKDGKQVVTLRSTQHATECVVECEVYPVSGLAVDPLSPGPYTFGTAQEATAFVDEAMQALTYLGCEVA